MIEKWLIVCGSVVLIGVTISLTIYNIEVEKTAQKAMELGYVQEVDGRKVLWVKSSVIVPLNAEGE